MNAAVLRGGAAGMLLGVLSAFALPSGAASPREPEHAHGYTRRVLGETREAREARRARVAARRLGPALIVHRGAAAFATENTLEAYAAAMDYGADGCEVDVRRTADGVLVLFHDDMLDHLTDGFGTVNGITYYELLRLRPRFLYGTARRDTRPPTFAALLTLARRRGMLLHLDIKEPELDTEIARELEGAGMWDHVVAVNSSTAPRLAADPRVRTLRYKAPGLYADRLDMDPTAVRQALARPGEMLMIDDPRVAARVLGREAYRPERLGADLREEWPRRHLEPGAGPRGFNPFVYLRTRAERSGEARVPELEALLTAGSPDERAQPDGTPEYQARRTKRILERAWAAQRLAERGPAARTAAATLAEQVRRRSLHRDWMYHGLDGAIAARALGELGAIEAVPVLEEALFRVDPELRKVVNPAFAANPLAWTDFRTKMYVLPALGELRCPASLAVLERYLALDPARARGIAPLQYEEAARGLLRQALDRADILALLQSTHGAVRGTALLECLDHPTPDRTAALREAVPWALDLPRARQ